MNTKNFVFWYSIIGIIVIIFGIFYAFYGLESLPVYKMFVPQSVYESWSNGLYGSTFIGFNVLLFFVGRYAFQNKDKALMKALLYGIGAWLIVEGLFSLYYGIYINVAVDVILAVFLGLPLVLGIKSKR